MSVYATGSGEIQIPKSREAAALAALAATRLVGPQDSLESAFSAIFDYVGLEEETIDAEEILFFDCQYSEKWDDSVEEALNALAPHVTTGRLEFQTGEGGSRWGYVFTGGTVRELKVISLFVGDPAPGADVVALNRDDVKRLIALVAGDLVDGLSKTIGKLAAAL